MSDTYPLSMRENKPSMHAVLIMNNRADGLPDGVHCGAYYVPETKEVFKRLVGRPYANADCLIRTQEDKFLKTFAGLPMMPQNWRIEQRNGLPWLVRQQAMIVSNEPHAEIKFNDLKIDTLLTLEWVVQHFNKNGWTLGDYITIGFDLKLYEYFIVDCSCAWQDDRTDDTFRIHKFFDLSGAGKRIAMLRTNARMALHNFKYGSDDNFLLDHEARQEYACVYASFNRPITSLWASIPDALYMHTERSNWDNLVPHTWVITKQPLEPDMMYRYELKFGYSKTYTTLDQMRGKVNEQ